LQPVSKVKKQSSSSNQGSEALERLTELERLK
jgi:hypothetical protein